MSKLFIVATPIGNLKDITFRALETLKQVDFILAEDTRVISKLLSVYEIRKPLIAFHHHSTNSQKIVNLLAEGKDLALVSDAGTPGINDPGGKLIEIILASGVSAEIIPIPGVSALTAILSIAGISLENFTYKGFVPHKKGKETFLKEVIASEIPVVFFESTHRILKTLERMKEFVTPEKRFIIGRELTKMHETVYRGTLDEILDALNKTSTKGEFVIISY